ncbi:type 2 lanthipeptide synthetase LanM family protein [Dyella choica]|uniref:Type 2 lantipeptide synthetase LanM n=1 Tax=Dyella choica TaxID=1927959 RepID=A0A3S0PPQ2_9GAMM|nr:type 2 lanthipeptide synthetase LanM family protein [Dyella choica]RUL78870.1 type 2 lantipeptide synthetase LanM [Dyella choica]
MPSSADAGGFTATLGCLVEPGLVRLAAQLQTIPGLGACERATILQATRSSLLSTLHGKLTRLLLLELNAARVTGRLGGEDAQQRWREFCAIAAELSWWEGLAEHYATLSTRIARIVDNRCSAILRFAQRWATDRPALASLCGGKPGDLLELSIGTGDSHCDGQSVVLLRTEGGRLVYKPHSVAVDAELHDLIEYLATCGSTSSMKVPRVAVYPGYGWAEFVAHRYAADDSELHDFYRGIGHWLALMRVLGGSDLHAENLIAMGPHPVVVDCETLFTPRMPPRPSGWGQAVDQAVEVLGGTVLAIGLLPARGQALGWRGVDSSGIGRLRGQQPMQPQAIIENVGTDEARLGSIMTELMAAQNQPSEQPALVRFWPRVLEAFDEMTACLRRLDAEGQLQVRLRRFADCPVRVVVRATEIYAEIGRMLWHPISLHDEGAARKRAFDLLAEMAERTALAPSDAAVIEAEIDALMVGDIPFFSTLPRHGRLDGPGRTQWLAPGDRIEEVLQAWRTSDLQLDRQVIQAALVSAFIGEGLLPKQGSLWSVRARQGDIERRRRHQSAAIMRQILANAIRGGDGSIAWIAPVVGPTSRTTQPIKQDLYNGISGIAVAVAAYLRETDAGRANSVDGLDELLSASLRTLDQAETTRLRDEAGDIKIRPRLPGGYVGLGSQIWTCLTLARWGIEQEQMLHRACALAAQLPNAVMEDTTHDVLSGVAGAIPPLLALAAALPVGGYLTMARQFGDLLCERARYQDGLACWGGESGMAGLGGFSHGATGIGWALRKLARASGESRYDELADAAFAYDDSLFDTEHGNWRDLRTTERALGAATWCNGAVGIGLAHVDLDPELTHPSTRLLLRRAAAATWHFGLGLDHCLCHGDLSVWEMFEHAIAAGEAPKGMSSEHLQASILSSLESHGPTCGMTKDIFVPGLMTGVAGVAYQLLRMHPASQLPSVLTLA